MVVSIGGCATYTHSFDGPTTPYVVQRGDTLGSLSDRTGVPLDSIIDINEIDDPDTLQVGQILYLPSNAKVERAPSKSITSAQPSPLVGDFSFVKYSDAEPLIGKLLWPVEEGKMGSKFGARSGRFHEGMDIRADIGRAVFAAHDGTVVFSGKLWSGYGNMIVLKGEGLYTIYAHNNINFVGDGDQVKAGDEIATVGQSGNASGPHLHFEVRIDDLQGYKVAVNPLIFLRDKY